MADRVVARGAQKYFPEDAPQTLRGVMPVQLLLLECTDDTRKRHTLFAVEVAPADGAEEEGPRYFTFPENTYAGMGVASDWLRKQLNETLGREPSAQPLAVSRVISLAPNDVLLENEVIIDVKTSTIT